MARIIEFEGRRIEMPDDATDAEVAQVLGMSGSPSAPLEVQNPDTAAAGEAAARRLAAGVRRPNTPPTPDGNPMRTLGIAAQGAGAGLAELAGLPVDTLTAAINLGTRGVNAATGASIPDIERPFMGSESIKVGAGKLSTMLGLPPVEYSDMPPREKLAYNVNRFGSQATGFASALAPLALKRATELAAGSASRAGDALLRPYMVAGDVGRTIAGDAAAGAGSGVGVTAADQAGYADSPLAQMLAALAGGVSGQTALSGAVGLTKGGAKLAAAPFGGNIVRDVVDPVTFRPHTKAAVDRAAATVQGRATSEPGVLLDRMAENRAALEPHIPVLPTPAALAQDPGLAGIEKQVSMAPTNRGQAISRDRDFRSAVRDTIDHVAPADATAQPLIDRVQRIADARTEQAQRAADRAQGRGRAVEMARTEEGAQLAPYASEGAKVDASRRLDRALVDEGYIPARAEKNRRFDEAPGRAEMVDAGPVLETAQAIRARNNALRPDEQIPTETVQRLEHLSVDNGGTGAVLAGDLADLRLPLAAARERARAGGNFTLADTLADLRGTINQTIEATPGYADANANYRQFAGTYRPSPDDPMAQFTRKIDRDPQRGATPPSETAGRFLSSGSPEDTAALARGVDASPAAAEGQRATRDYLVSDLATKGVLDQRSGVIRPDRLRAWMNSRGDFNTLPQEFQREVRDMLARAQRGERLAGGFADELKAAQTNLKRTQDDIDKGALGLVLGSDPDKAVSAVMNKTNSSGRLLNELIRVTEADPQARQGLKAAVRDFLVNKATTNAEQNLRPGDTRGPVSFEKLSNILSEHEKEMARIFSPEEMNTLRAGHKAMALANLERLRVGTGSDTAEKVGFLTKMRDTPLGRGLEAAARLSYGALETGGKIAGIRRAIGDAPSATDRMAHQLVERAAFDPDLMALLLGRKLQIGSPAWNNRLGILIGVGEGARDAQN